jgi:hypothetical protein
MTSLSGSLLALRTAYGLAHRRLLGEGSPAALELELCEALVETLPAEALKLSATQAVLCHLARRLPDHETVRRWRSRAGVHLYSLGAEVREPLYSFLYDLEPAPAEAET